jgi:hypothetical protein
MCAFCGKDGPLTKEHLWPTSLHKRLNATNEQTGSSFWLQRLQKELASEPQIKDVCAHCNNVVLSHLDDYICQLFDATFAKMPLRYERVRFTFKYHLLKRWLLKMCYNSARIHNSRDLFALKGVLPYILGQSDQLGRSVQVYLQLSYAQAVPDEDLPTDYLGERPALFYPSYNRVGFIYFQDILGKKLLRAVHLRSFSFFLSFYHPDGNSTERRHFAEVFTSRMSHLRLLRPSEPQIDLICDGSGAWDSIRGSRVNRFESGPVPPEVTTPATFSVPPTAPS